MNSLSLRDRELVALGAAMGSNCVPCVEYHIPESRKAGLADAEIHAAIQHADKIRQVPARKTLQAALKLLPSAAGNAPGATAGESGGCGATAPAVAPDAGRTAQSGDPMMSLMSKMLASCGESGLPAAAPGAAKGGSESAAATGPGSACC